MAYATTNPYTRKVLKTFPTATDREIDQALDDVQAAFLFWKETTFAERARQTTYRHGGCSLPCSISKTYATDGL